MVDRIRETAETFGEVSQSLAEISVGTEQITATLERTGRNSRTVRDFCVDMLSA
jgi:methyl-accepting chemotaxis protein